MQMPSATLPDKSLKTTKNKQEGTAGPYLPNLLFTSFLLVLTLSNVEFTAASKQRFHVL